MDNGRVYHDTRYFNTYDAARSYAVSGPYVN